jgi:hypothetical protein
MNTTFEIEEVSSDFFSALENAELCHGVKRNLALEISRDEPKIGKTWHPQACDSSVHAIGETGCRARRAEDWRSAGRPREFVCSARGENDRP